MVTGYNLQGHPHARGQFTGDVRTTQLKVRVMLFPSQLGEYPESPPKTSVGLFLVSVSILFAVQYKCSHACFWQALRCGIFFNTWQLQSLNRALVEGLPVLFFSTKFVCIRSILLWALNKYFTGVLIKTENQHLSYVCFVSSLHVFPGLKSLLSFCRVRRSVEFLHSLTHN